MKRQANLVIKTYQSNNWLLVIKHEGTETVVDTGLPYVKGVTSLDIDDLCAIHDCEIGSAWGSDHFFCNYRELEPLTFRQAEMRAAWHSLVPVPDTVSRVGDFHRAFDYEIPKGPSWAGYDPMSHRHALLCVRNTLKEHLAYYKNTLACRNPVPQALQRVALIWEELVEYIEAIIDQDMVECLDSLEDLMYVVSGSIVAHGFSSIHNEAFRRVHASNMSKLKDGKVVKDERGKVVKGDWYKPVQLRDLIETEGHEVPR